MPIRHARAPHRAFPRRRSHRTGPTRGGARRHDGFPLPTRSTPSSVTSRNALCENAIGLNEPGRVCHRGSTAGRWKPAPIRCTVQACALVAGLRRPLGHGKLHPYCFERQHGGYRRVALCALSRLDLQRLTRNRSLRLLDNYASEVVAFSQRGQSQRKQPVVDQPGAVPGVR